MAARQQQPRNKDDRARRYRDAAQLAIEQLDWAIDYLRRINKSQIANVLQRNRDTIVSNARR